MHEESHTSRQQYEIDTRVEAYGFEWRVSDIDYKGRYTLVFEHWTLYGVDPIQVKEKRT
jgi:hypothetical protein